MNTHLKFNEYKIYPTHTYNCSSNCSSLGQSFTYKLFPVRMENQAR